MSKFIEPLYDRVVLKVLTEEKIGNIFLSEDVQFSKRAEVVAVGPGKYNIDTEMYTKMHVKAGDIVFVNTQFGTRLKFQQGSTDNFILMKEDDIFGLEIEVE